MVLDINKFSNNYADNNVNKYSLLNNVPMRSFKGKEAGEQKIDKSNDGQFSASEATKNFAKGLVSPITSMFSSAKNFVAGVGMIAGSAAIIAATGGAAAPIIVAAGLGMGALQAGKTAIKFANAKNGDDAEKAFYDAGSTVSTLGLSAIGAKSSLTQAGIETKNVGILNAVKNCVTSTKNQAVESFKVFTTGYYKTNLSNAWKVLTQPKSLIKYAKELHEDGDKNFSASFDAIKNIFPEELRSSIIGRNKCEVSIYEKLVKERTTKIKDDLKKVNNKSKMSEEVSNRVNVQTNNDEMVIKIKLAKDKTSIAESQLQKQINQEVSNEIEKGFEIGKLNNRKQLVAEDSQFAKSTIGDRFGARLVLDDVSEANIDKVVASLVEAANKGEIKITELENYKGYNSAYKEKGTYYFNDEQVEAIHATNLKMKVVKKSKQSGYSAVQLKVTPKNGETMELQIRGKDVDAFADVEHYPYDLRQNKDIAKGNNQIGIRVAKVKNAIKSLTKDQYNKYKKYIYDTYIYAQAKERGNNLTKPELPSELNNVLSAESLTQLHNDTVCFSTGTIKNPLSIKPIAPFVAGGESVLEN